MHRRAALCRIHNDVVVFGAFESILQCGDRLPMLQYHLPKLTMPIFALGGERSFGTQQAEIMRVVGTNVEGGIIPNSGHWVMEEQPEATVKMVSDFLNKK